MEHPFPKLFTVEEANALLPDLQEVLWDIFRHRDALRKKAPHMEPILGAAPTNGGGREGSEYDVEAYQLYRSIDRIREMGVVLKDLDMGLLDFPHERDEQVVFLCWHPPEERIEYWHELDTGYQERQPL